MRRTGLALVLLAAAACSKTTTTTAPPSASPPLAATQSASPHPSPSPRPSTCQSPAGTYRKQVDGRQVVIELPKSSSQSRRPVVVALHGYQGDAADFASYTGLAARASALGVVALFPQGVGSPAGWNYPRSRQLPADDVAFLDSMLGQLAPELCLDLGRLVVTGWSDGADMAVTYGCWGQHRLRGLVAVSAGTGPRQESCHTRSVTYVHGTADPIEPYSGGGADGRAGYGGARSVSPRQATQQWAERLQCKPFAARPSAPETSTEQAPGCRNGGTVGFVTIQGGGHGWPSSTYDISATSYGPTNHTFDTDGAILALL